MAKKKKKKKTPRTRRPKPPPLNFLQDHYNRAMKAGGGHTNYVIINDLSDETARELRDIYERHYERRR